MNSRFEFVLTPAYCLFNGVAVLGQEGACISFLIENDQNEMLKARLKRAFENHLCMIQKIKECPEIYRRIPSVEFTAGSRGQLRKCVSRLYSAPEKSVVPVKKATGDFERTQREAAAVLLLDSILNEARVRKATDIHIEQNCVRLRVNGHLEKLLEIQSEKGNELVQRIKLLAGMNVIEKRSCQDGHFVYGTQNPFFLRVSTMAVVGENYMGEESVVIRILDTSRVPLELDQLGFNLTQLESIEVVSQQPSGLILVCGPTGSGKSTTVASILVDIEKRYGSSLKILSLEDPPEYVIPGVTQVKVDERNGFTQALNHIFRQDPDVIMIGEIRDEESAAAALRAALTGHLVFATVHAGNAGEAILRLENLGLERRLFSPIIRGVICQQLDYSQGRNWLYADLALPSDTFASACLRAVSDEDFENLFIHQTNYTDILSQTIKELSKKHQYDAPNALQKKPAVRRLPYYKGGKNAKRIHGRAV